MFRRMLTIAMAAALTLAAPSARAAVSFVPSIEGLPHKPVSSPVAAVVPAEPILRLETGMPSGAFAGLATDPQGRWLVIAGEDETARIWSIDTGQPVSVLRPPIGPGHVGSISAAAISSDGQTVALGWRSEESASIFLFDRATGVVKKRIDRVLNVPTGLKFSPHDVQLAVSLVSGGMQVFNVASGLEIGHDVNYVGPSYSVDFSPDGRYILVTCTDGLLHLYGVDRGHISKLTVAKADNMSAKPTSARFGPDGKHVALAYDTISAIEIRDILDLSRVTNLVTPFISSTFSDSSWSRNGRFIYSSYVGSGGNSLIRRWGRAATPDSSTGSPINILSPHDDIQVSGHGLITGVLALANGGAVFATSGPAWGIVTPEGQVEWRQGGANNARYANYAVDPARPIKLLLSPDGTRVGFNYDGKKEPAVFDIATRAIGADQKGLAGPRLTAPGLSVSITGHMSLFSLATVATLNRQPLKLAPNDYATTYAIAPDGQSVVVGSAFAVTRFGKDGSLIWRKAGRAYAVNCSADGKWVVADFRDGTLHWYRASDGSTALTLFPHPDRHSWVLWTSSGYYDASTGGEDFIGWHLNHGLDTAADFVPASRFSELMRRPDVVDRILQAKDEGEALRLANGVSFRTQAQLTPQTIAASLPPVLILDSAPTEFSGQPVTVTYRVTTAADAPMLGPLRININGEWQPATRAAYQASADGVRSIVLSQLPALDSVVELYAENRHGVSPALTLNLKWVGTTVEKAVAKPRPRLFVLAIGVSAYQRKDLQLKFADRDAQFLGKALQAQQGKGYSQVTVRALVDGDATQQKVLDGLTWLKSQVRGNDVGIVFLAGHGYRTAADDYYFAPVDFDPLNPAGTGVSNTVIVDALAEFSRAGNKAVFMIDTCYAGGALSKNLNSSNGGRLAETLNDHMAGVVVLAASRGDQVSMEDASLDGGHGIFTAAILDGIVAARAGSPQSPDISVMELQGFVHRQVMAQSKERQEPLFLMGQGLADFPVAYR